LAQSQKTLIRFELIERSYVRPDEKDGCSVYADIREKYETGADVTLVKYHPDGQHFLSAHYSQVQVWRTGVPDAFYKIERQNVRGAALSPDGDHIAISHGDSELSVFEFKTGEKLYGFSAKGTGKPYFSPDGKSIALAGEDGSVTLYSLPSGQLGSHFGTGAPRTAPLCFGQDGRFLFTGGEKNEIIVWSLQSGKKERTLMGHSMPVTALSESSKNSFLLSASEDMTLIRWAQDWEYEFPGLTDMDEGAMPYVRQLWRKSIPRMDG
jgi:WD40 repeat protein